jgi:hypothetical protein
MAGRTAAYELAFPRPDLRIARSGTTVVLNWTNSQRRPRLSAICDSQPVSIVHFTPGCNVNAPGKFSGSHRTDLFAGDSYMGSIPTAFWAMTIRIVFPKRKKALRMA